MSDIALEELIYLVITDSRNEYQAQLYTDTPANIVEIEFNKIFQQIREWINIELQREAFTCQPEVDKTLTLAGMQFNFRIDRVDTSQSGELEIIDYKSGSVDIKKWLGKRPTEAQMPAYALACIEAPIRSLSYAKLKTGEISRNGIWFENNKEDNPRFLEISSDSTKDHSKRILSNSKWCNENTTLMKQWKENLTFLASQIVSGEMPVSPKQATQSCRYCDYSAFCRISEAQPESQSDEVLS